MLSVLVLACITSMKRIFLASLGFPLQLCCIKCRAYLFFVRFNSLLGVLVFGCVDVEDDAGKLGFPLQLCSIKCCPTLAGILGLTCLLHDVVICLVCGGVTI